MSNVKHQQKMRVIFVVVLVTAKLSALGLLPILVLGYVFFLGSHSLLSHVYVAATCLGLLLTLAAGPNTFRSLRVVYGISVLAALPLGCWKIHEHLSFHEGPNYSAAGMNGLAVAAMVVGFVCCRHLLLNGGNAHVDSFAAR